MDPAVLFIAFALAAIMSRLAAGSFDGERIERYVKDNGWELVDRSWDPLGPGWFGEEDSRIYQIVYRNQHGELRRAHVKTSMLSGVYLTNDRIVEEANPSKQAHTDSLAEENRQLKERIRELEQEKL